LFRISVNSSLIVGIAVSSPAGKIPIWDGPPAYLGPVSIRNVFEDEVFTPKGPWGRSHRGGWGFEKFVQVGLLGVAGADHAGPIDEEGDGHGLQEELIVEVRPHDHVLHLLPLKKESHAVAVLLGSDPEHKELLILDELLDFGVPSGHISAATRSPGGEEVHHQLGLDGLEFSLLLAHHGQEAEGERLVEIDPAVRAHDWKRRGEEGGAKKGEADYACLRMWSQAWTWGLPRK
jgi:hypothetical protein